VTLAVTLGTPTDMPITNALASLAVRDLAASSKWYEQLLGPGSRPMAEVVEWQLERGGGLQVYTAPERAGQGSCTLIVSDIDEIAQRLRATGLAADAEPARTDRVDTIMVKDPDGNSIAFSMPKDRTLAH
jgi:predicted enzyme related to lactoylglutathione lyase